jgi:hypothetical protein
MYNKSHVPLSEMTMYSSAISTPGKQRISMAYEICTAITRAMLISSEMKESY